MYVHAIPFVIVEKSLFSTGLWSVCAVLYVLIIYTQMLPIFVSLSLSYFWKNFTNFYWLPRASGTTHSWQNYLGLTSSLLTVLHLWFVTSWLLSSQFSMISCMLGFFSDSTNFQTRQRVKSAFLKNVGASGCQKVILTVGQV